VASRFKLYSLSSVIFYLPESNTSEAEALIIFILSIVTCWPVADTVKQYLKDLPNCLIVCLFAV
jgi:hypothetical protein